MPTSEEFIKKLGQEVDIVTVITKFFDEIMTLYSLMGTRDVVNICLDDESTASFTVNMNSKEAAERVYNDLNNCSFEIYETCYNIHVVSNNTESVVVLINKASS